MPNKTETKTKMTKNLISIIVDDVVACDDSITLVLSKPVSCKSLVSQTETIRGQGYMKDKTLFCSGKEVSQVWARVYNLRLKGMGLGTRP